MNGDDNSIGNVRRNLVQHPPGSAARPDGLMVLSYHLIARYQRTHQLSDLNEAVSTTSEALHLCPKGHERRRFALEGFAIPLTIRFDVTKDPSDVERAVQCYRELFDLQPPGHPTRVAFLAPLTRALKLRAERTSTVGHWREYLVYQRQHLAVLPSGDPKRASHELGLSRTLKTLHDYTAQIELIDEVIGYHREDLTNENRFTAVFELAAALQARYTSHGDPKDLSEAVFHNREALGLAESTPDRIRCLNNLGVVLTMRFRITAESGDVEEALKCHRETINTCPPGLPFRSFSQTNLAIALGDQYKRMDTDTSNDVVLTCRYAVIATQIGHQSLPYALNNLANALRAKHEQTADTESMQEAFRCYRTALELHPATHPDHGIILMNIADATRIFFLQSRDVQHLDESISYARQAHSCFPKSNPNHLRVSSILALTLQAHFSFSRNSEDLDEAIALQKDVLAYVAADHPLFGSKLDNLGHAVRLHFQETGEMGFLEGSPMDPRHQDDLASSLRNLVASYGLRGWYTEKVEDLEDMITYSRAEVLLLSPGHPRYALALNNLASSLFTRFQQVFDVNVLDEIVACLQQARTCSTPNDPHYLLIQRNAANILLARFKFAHDPNYEDLAESITQNEHLLSLPTHPLNTEPKATILHVLGDSWKLRFEKTRDPQDLDKSISYHHDAVLLQGDDNILPMGLCMLAEALKARAEFNGDATDLDEALGHLYTALSVHLPDHPQCAYNLGAVAKVFQARYGLSNDADDLDQAIEYYTAAAEHTASHLRLRSLAAGEWVNFAHACGHRSALTGYQTALDLLQDTLALDPMLELQHRFIRSAPHLQALPCDAMAAALQFGEVGMAVRMLEQGRGALWTELRGLRSPLHDLQDAQPALAERLLANREKLEVLSTAPEHAMVSDVQTSTSVGYDNIRYHNRLLLEEQESVLAEIRSLPAFANFRTGENLAINLNEVAAEGPVIVVNLSAKRSDVVILVSNQPPACLRLPDTFLDDVTALVAHLQTGRERSYKQFNKALRHVLRETWDLIGAPVVKKLKELQVAKGSRIWWCPTGILCLLPIHAAGPISPGSSRHLLDLYVSSYTPTLTALVDARKDAPVSSSQPSTLPKVLIVAQPDPTLPTVELEVATIASLAEDVTCLLSSDATKSAVTASLPSHPWVHFACHGNIQPSRPFSSSFLLAHAEHLTLLDITRIKASSRELAFLSACHSAGAPDDSAYNEALQLSTAMQFCGYRSVVGTMWAMVDADGVQVARTFYENMLSREEGMREFGFRRSARAICEAAKQLRRQKVDLERWVNFIHIGA